MYRKIIAMIESKMSVNAIAQELDLPVDQVQEIEKDYYYFYF